MKQKNRFIVSNLIMAILVILLIAVAIAVFVFDSQLQNWLSLLVILIPILFVLLYGILFYAPMDLTCGFFQCQHCRNKFVPTKIDYYRGMHTITHRHLTCPKCGRKSWCKKVFDA